MVDTIRDLAALLTLLADNTTGNISPQDVRDMLVSLHSVRGEFFIADNEAGSPQTIGTSFQKVSQLTSKGQESGVIVDNVTDFDIQVGTTGVYLCLVSLSFSGTANTTFQISTFKNNVQQMVSKITRKIGSGGDVGDSAGVGMISCAADDLLDVRVIADGTGKSFLVEDGQFNVLRIA